MKSIATLVLLVLSFSVQAARLHPESYYQDLFCGENPVTLKDGTRADCIKDGVVWELDFWDKWYEGVGQALHYSRVTGKPPGVVILLDTVDETNMNVVRFVLLMDYLKALRIRGRLMDRNGTIWKVTDL